MIKFVSLLLAGLSLGAIYSLVSMGFVIIYKSSGILNFAHGSFLVFAAFVVAVTQGTVGFGWAFVIALVATGLLALIVEVLFVRPMRNAPPVPTTILTIGIEVLLGTLLATLIGSDLLDLGQPWGGSVTTVGDFGITVNRLIALVAAAVIIAVFFALFRYSSWGISMRAAAEDREAAALVGVRLGRVAAMSWAAAGLLACVAAVFLTGAPTPGLSPSLAAVALIAFPAAIIGGVTSIPGALLGGLIVGISESLATGYQDQLLFLGRGFGEVVPYVVLLIVLLIRPQGILGEKERVRV
ncbi:branched-chain amino acid ABC transporter permease [Okibacterium endophyticum]